MCRGPAGRSRQATSTCFADPADSTDLTKALAHAPPDESWELATHVRVPALPRGRHEIFACQASACAGGAGQTRALQLSAVTPRFDLTAHAAYVIVVQHTSRPPTLSLTPNSGIAGTEIHASGSGWVAGAGPVWIFASKQAVSSTANALVSKTPDHNGAVSVGFSAPALGPGRHVFYACRCAPARTPV